MKIELPNGTIIEITDKNKNDRECILDLTKLLRGHEGEMFWSPCWGECEFLEIHDRNGGRSSIKFRTKNGECRNVTPSGCLGYNYEGCGGECIIWPSKNHQTWADFGI